MYLGCAEVRGEQDIGPSLVPGRQENLDISSGYVHHKGRVIRITIPWPRVFALSPVRRRGSQSWSLPFCRGDNGVGMPVNGMLGRDDTGLE